MRFVNIKDALIRPESVCSLNVYFDDNIKKYRVRLVTNGGDIAFGEYNTVHEAHEAKNVMALNLGISYQ